MCVQKTHGPLHSGESGDEHRCRCEVRAHPHPRDGDHLGSFGWNLPRVRGYDPANSGCEHFGAVGHARQDSKETDDSKENEEEGVYTTRAMPGPVSLLFCGTSTFAIPSLEELTEDGRFAVKAVITQPDKPVGRHRSLTPPPVKVAAERLGLVVLQPQRINDSFATLGLDRPDFLVVASYGQILKKHILSFPRIAPVNVHASLLPKLRGASPVQNAILEGLTETGVTIQRMAEELDAGPILAQQRRAIDPRETFTSLLDKLALLGAELLRSTLLQPLNAAEQDHNRATYCRKLSRADGFVNPATMTAEEIDRRVRALTPWPGVTWDDRKILETALAPAKDAFPLPCRGGTVLYVTRIQASGRKPMTGAEFSRGHRTP